MASKTEETASSKRSINDIIIIFVTALISFALASVLDAFKLLTEWSGRQSWELTQLYFFLVVLAFAFGLFSLLGIFSMRRWLQLQRELTRRTEAEEALQKTHEELERRVQERTTALSQANAKLVDEIVEREIVEKALRESEELFRQVITSISDHIYVSKMNDDGSHLNRYLSPHVEALTGYPKEKLLVDWSFWPTNIVHPEDRERAAEQAAQLAQGNNSEVEYRLVKATGEEIWVRDSARVEQISESSRLVYGVVSDITERKQAEAEIKGLNEALEKRVKDRTRKLATLYEVTALANKSLDSRLTMKLSLERLLMARRSAAGAIHLSDENEETLLPVAEKGIPPEIASYIGPSKDDNGLVSRVIQQNQPLYIPNLKDEPNASDSIKNGGFHTYLGIPIRAKGHPLGVLSVLDKKQQQFDEGDIAHLVSIAGQMGVAVDNDRLQKQAQQGAVMRERARLARELHDSVTQSLYSLTLFAEAGSELAETADRETIKHNFTRIGETGLQALKEMRLLVYELRPMALQKSGLIGALHERLNAVEGRVNVQARLIADDLEQQLPAHVEEGLYGIAQEALNNILKHAAATSVTIHLRNKKDGLELEIVDNGKGFNLDAADETSGMGLGNMRERAKKLGGSMAITSELEKGTTITVSIPLESRPVLQFIPQ